MNDVTKAAVFLLAAAFLAAALLAVYMIGAETLRNVAYILAGAVALALILASSALPIRAAKKRDVTGEANHYYHDGTRTVEKIHTIDGRAVTSPEVKLLQLPQQPAGGAWPELLRASYQAGLLGNGQRAATVPSSELAEYDLTGGNGAGADDWYDPAGEWGGNITP